MKAPNFWHRDGLLPRLLAPAGLAFAAGGAFRRLRTTPARASVPVLCVGNLIAGGAGKTPVVLALARWLAREGKTPHILTRGYGGTLAGPVRVDPARHDFHAVGDEPLLLSEAAPTWVARDRPAGARAAAAAGAGLILMDDGLQNPSLVQDGALMVVDGGYGFGNGRIIPAGPLRESVANGARRTQLAVLIGEDKAGAAAMLSPGLPIARAHLAVPEGAAWMGRRVLAFAGIGRPEKFFETLAGLGAILVARQGFPDHYAYGAEEIELLLTAAAAIGATPITTTKDHVRLPAAVRAAVAALPVELAWNADADEALIRTWLDQAGVAL